MKLSKIISLAAAGILLCTSVTGCSKSKEEKKTEEAPKKTFNTQYTSPVSANECAKNMGIGINLGNTMEAYISSGSGNFKWVNDLGSTPQDYERCWGATETTKECIDGMKEAGFSTVRVPVFWGNMMKDDGKWEINKDYMARVQEIVEYCVNDDLYVVINIHHFDEFIIRRHNLEESQEIFTTIWTQIADSFKDYPYNVVFEGYNEYLGGGQFNDKEVVKDLPKGEAYNWTNTLNQTFVDAVRKTGGNNADRVLIASGYWTNIDNTTTDQFVMPADTAENKLMVSVHYVDNAMYWTNQIGNAAWEEYIDDQIGKLNNAFTSKNIPVFVGETTAIYPTENFAADATYANSQECLEYLLNKIADNGFVPVLWDTDNNFYSRAAHIIMNPDDEQVIKRISEKLAK